MRPGLCSTVLISIALLVSQSSGQDVAVPAAPCTMPGSGPVGTVPFTLARPFGLLLVRVEVDGRPATLVVDTGASHTILSRRFGQVPIQTKNTSPLRGSGLIGTATWVRASIRLGAHRWPDHQFLAMDDFPDISRAVGQPVDGILGEDILKEFSSVIFDFKHNRMVLLP